MTNPTSNFGWQMPTSTDLVTDLPADFEVFGQAVDTSLADLKGGTSGQILSKASNTDMDFTWITNDVGDITAVNVTAPITGGGTSGAVTIGVDAASTSAAGVVQLSDSTSTTSSVLASTPTATKSAYDLAAAAIPKSTVTTAGDVIYATGSGAVTRLGIGTTGQVLTVNGGGTAPSWATPATSGFVGYSGYAIGTQSIAHNTYTALPMDGENFDTSSFHSTSTNNTRITIPSGKGGYYLVTGFGYFDVATGGKSTALGVRKNGSGGQYYFTGTYSTGAYSGVTFNQIMALAAGDYIEFMAYQGTGAGLNFTGGSTAQNLSVQFLGA